jgi:hypothetical protein
MRVVAVGSEPDAAALVAEGERADVIPVVAIELTQLTWEPSRSATCLPRSRYGISGATPQSSAKWSCTSRIAMEPSPTADATRLIEPEWTSPTAKIPGRLVSRNSGRSPSNSRR